MLREIAAAEKTITLEVYEFWGEKVGAAFAEALAGRASEGVAVHAIFDYIGSLKADPAFFEKMEEAGVDLIRWRRPSWCQSSRFNHRTHRKLMVADGRIGFTGGANIADAWVGNDPEETYQDYHFRFEGPITGHLQAAFMDNWLFSTGGLLLGDRYFPVLEEEGEIEAQLVLSSPREGHKRIRSLALLALAGAEERVRIGTAFFYPDPMMVEALGAASRRGVQVEILAPGEKIKEEWVRHASRNRWGNLLRAGVRIHEYQDSLYHAKMIIVDDKWVSIGSANFDNRSFRINDEANVNIFDAEFVREMHAVFEDDLSRAKPYELEAWEARPWINRVRGFFGNLIGPHL